MARVCGRSTGSGKLGTPKRRFLSCHPRVVLVRSAVPRTDLAGRPPEPPEPASSLAASERGPRTFRTSRSSFTRSTSMIPAKRSPPPTWCACAAWRARISPRRTSASGSKTRTWTAPGRWASWTCIEASPRAPPPSRWSRELYLGKRRTDGASARKRDIRIFFKTPRSFLGGGRGNLHKSINIK